ncbi:ligand-binding sensor domain-containing diguanylate cyclase [Kineobactrum salinum]|uniref:ligand-binding sensor domain-containing diguanylate cyclase n=1 Tax=Kineobactrum salinum TaxID=2708301 RepID=UPI001E5C0293|nr:diguanylate cyclase [Kineobactrum salinum]
MPWHSAVRDRDGNLWLGTYGQGLWRLSPDQQLEEIPLTTTQPGHVFELTEDREGNVWAATMQGAYRLRDSDFLQFGQPEGLADPVFVVTQSPVDDAIWAGSEGSGLFRLGRDGDIRQLGTEQGLSNINVSALLVDPDNTVWAGTFGGGLNRIASDGSISHFSVENKLPDNHVMGLTRSRDGRLWVAANGGLGYLDPGADVFERQHGLPETLLRQIMEDSRGALWIASNSGLIRLQNGESTLWDSSDGLGSSLVSTTYEDADGVLWIGSREAGLARLEGDRLFQYGLQHGLPQLSVLAILEDDQDTLWMSGADGLVSVPRAELNAVARSEADQVRAQLYDETDGLRSAQFLGGFQPAGWRARDGTLWFGSNRGLVAVDPTGFEPAAPVPRPLIEQVRVNGEVIAPAQPLQLPADAHTLEVDYTVPRLGNPEAIRFRYQLEGFDRDWQDVAGRRTAYFTGLTPGKTTLHIAAHLKDSAFDPTRLEQQVSLEIYREPYWYQTWWFLLLACAVVGLALLAIYRFIRHRAGLRERRLELLVGRRTRELQIALSRVEEISRIDSLTGVANRRFLDENLDKAWSQCAAKQVPVSVIMLDLDFFKQYNDSTGHQAGDDCLRRVAESLQAGVLREGDLIARYGGEEFIALLPGADSAAALAGAQRIHSRIGALRIPHPDSPVSDFVSVSVGVATAWPGSAPGTPDLLMQRADRALYAAKSGGRDRVSVWEQGRSSGYGAPD